METICRNELVIGRTYNWCRVLTPRYASMLDRPTRIATVSANVQLLGTVPFEPSLVRVRMESGHVERVHIDELREV
jgi:hypothetical protein